LKPLPEAVFRNPASLNPLQMGIRNELNIRKCCLSKNGGFSAIIKASILYFTNKIEGFVSPAASKKASHLNSRF
jgi:hypothetical protein